MTGLALALAVRVPAARGLYNNKLACISTSPCGVREGDRRSVAAGFQHNAS